MVVHHFKYSIIASILLCFFSCGENPVEKKPSRRDRRANAQNHGVDSSRELSSLSEEEKQKVTDFINSELGLRERRETFCKIYAYLHRDEEICKSSLKRCLEKKKNLPWKKSYFRKCSDIKMETVESCLRGHGIMHKKRNNIIAKYSCESLPLEDSEDEKEMLRLNQNSPVSCAEIGKKCKI